jgi:hypothetical protein
MNSKLIKILVAIMLCVSFTGCHKIKAPDGDTNAVSQKSSPDFRKIKWGMSQEEVTSIEGSPDDIKLEYIGYYGLTVAEIDVLLVYYFNGDDQLYKAIYASAEEHTNRNDYITDFDNLSSALTEKYGDPLESDTIWKDDLYQDDPSEWGMAICVGHMMKYAKWETDTTNITIVITGDNYEISTMIGYESKTTDAPEDNKTDGL